MTLLDGRSDQTRRYIVLNAGREMGWWAFEVTGKRKADMRYTVTLTGRHKVTRVLLPDEVLPWALGVADAKGMPDVVAYREGLLPEN
jgi:hypothetical protein